MQETKERVKIGQVTLRRAEWSDFPLFVEWRSLPQVYESITENPYPLSEQEVADWMGSYLNDIDEKYGLLKVIEVDGRPVGYGLIRGLESGIPEYGLAIAYEDYWKVGVKQEARRLGMEILKGLGFKKVRVRTKILDEKIDKEFIAFGYEKIFQGENYIWWLKSL